MSNKRFNQTGTNQMMRAGSMRSSPLTGSSSTEKRKVSAPKIRAKSPDAKVVVDPSLRSGGTGKGGTDISKIVKEFTRNV